MKRALIKTSVAVVAAFALAQTSLAAEFEGKRLAALSFNGLDQNSDGFGTMEEYQAWQADVFLSMDSNDNQSLTFEEFSGWGFGFPNVAEQSGREQAYETALKVVFDLWDRSFDWKLSPEEHRRGIAEDFFNADENRDGRLTEQEYIRFSIVNITARSALRPEQ